MKHCGWWGELQTSRMALLQKALRYDFAVSLFVSFLKKRGKQRNRLVC